MVDKQDGEFGVGEMKDGRIDGNAKISGTSHENCKSESNIEQSSINGHAVNIQGDGHHFDFRSTHESQCNSPAPVKKPISEGANLYEAVIVLTGKLSANNLVEFKDKQKEINGIVAHLKKRYDIDLTIMDVSEGSVKLKLSGSKEDIEKLKALFESGELKEILDIPVQDVQCEDLSNTESADQNDLTKRKSSSSLKQSKTNQHFFYDEVIAEAKRLAKEENSILSIVPIPRPKYQQSGQFGIGNMEGEEIKLNAKVAGIMNEEPEKSIEKILEYNIAVINQLSDSPKQQTPGIKELLIQLQEAIASESKLSDDDKKDALEELGNLAALAQKPEDDGSKKAAKRAIRTITVIFTASSIFSKLIEKVVIKITETLFQEPSV